ncbi:peptide chain release factor 2 [candidate division KSB1 bacterium]
MNEGISTALGEIPERLEKIREYLDIDEKKKQIAQLEKESSGDTFWLNQEKAQKALKMLSFLRETVDRFDKCRKEAGDIKELLEIAEAENDEETGSVLEDEIRMLLENVQNLELDIMLDGEDDDKNAIMTINPGAGGTESQDWAEMLLRMYLRWLESRNFQVNVLEQQNADDAGIKGAALEIKGKNAYGYSKAEIGVHRLVRLSPFDSNHRRHTSFASVFVYPEIEDDITIDINPNDLRIDTFRASGAGGQHVNKTDSAIRITHLPTGVVASCQNERSQHKNKDNAMKILKSRLYALKKEEENAKLEELEKSKTDIAWGNQIRSYTLQPYNLVKDHRTNVETGNVQAVLGGDLDQFVTAYLLQKKKL